MKPKTTIVLIVLLALCAAFLLVRHAGWFSAPPKLPEEKLLLRPAGGPIDSIRVVDAAGGEIVLARVQGRWRLTQPLAAKADDAAALALADALSSLRYVRKIAPDQKDAEASLTGLDKPLWTVTLTDDRGASRTIYVGKPAPLSRQETYVRTDADKAVYVVGVDLAAQLGRTAGEYRDRDVFDLAGGRVERLAVESAQRSFELARTGGQWDLVRPVAAKAQQGAAGKLVRTLLDLRVKQFVADRPQRLSDYGLDPPNLLVRLWVSQPAPIATAPSTAPATAPAEQIVERTLAFGRTAKEEVYAKLLDQPTVFKLDASLLKDLLPEWIDLRQRNVLQVNEDLVVGVDVQTPDGKAVLKKDEKDSPWRMVEPFAGAASAEQVGALLQAAATLQAEAFEDSAGESDLPRFGLDHPRGRLDLHQAGTDHPLTLLIGRASPSGEMTFVKASDGNAVAVVRSDAVEPLLADPAGYWTTTLMELPRGYVPVALAVVRTDGGVTLKHTAQGWHVAQPLRAEVDAEHLNKILDHLEKLTVTKVVSVGTKVPDKYRKVEDLISVGLTVQFPPTSQPATAAAETQPAATQPVSTQPGAQPATTQPAGKTVFYALRIGKVMGQVYAWIDNQKVVAVGSCSQQLFDDFKAELRQRTVLKIDPATIRKIAVSAGKDSLTLQRQGGQDDWTSASDPYVRIDAEKVRSYLQRIEQIQAVKFLGYTAADIPKFQLAEPWMQIELAREEGEPVRLLVSTEGTEGGRYAAVSDVPGVFLLSADDTAKIACKLQDFQKK